MSQSANPQPKDNQSSFAEALLKRRFIEPLASIIPSSVHPNSITAITPFVAISSFALAVSAPSQTPGTALLFRVLAGVLMFASMLTDHVDGLHARRTKQTSKFGEALDHWLDSLHVPLGAAGFAATLGGHGWVLASVCITAGGVYNSQLVLYHDTKKFVYPPTGAAGVQMLAALAYVASGLLLYFGPTTNPNFLLGIQIFLWMVVVGQVRNVLFYWNRLRRRMLVAMIFFVLSYAFVYPLIRLQLPAWFLAVFLCLVSLALSGSWILCTITGKTCGGIGFAVPFVLVLLLGTMFARDALPPAVVERGPWVMAGMLIGAAIVEFRRRMRPSTASAGS